MAGRGASGGTLIGLLLVAVLGLRPLTGGALLVPRCAAAGTAAWAAGRPRSGISADRRGAPRRPGCSGPGGEAGRHAQVAAPGGPGGGGVNAQDGELGVRKTVLLILSGLLGPVLCIGFVRFTAALNRVVVGYGPLAEVSAYTASSALLFAMVKSNVVGGSARASVIILCGLLKKLCGGRETWISESMRKLAGPMAAITQGVLSFLAVNLLVNAIPDNFAWQVPNILRFCDINGDGVLEAAEIESMFYMFTIRVLGCYLVLQATLFLNNLRQPPKTPVPDSAGDPLAWYYRGLQRLRGPRQGLKDMPPRLIIWLRVTNALVALLILLCASFAWASIVGLPMRTIFAAMAPLGIGGLAFSLAAQNIVQNIISGGLIFLNRAFVEGDEIRSIDGKITGVVEKVGLINTSVMRLEGDPVVIPNAQLVDNSIVNHQRRDFWLINESLPLYMSSFARLREVVAAMDIRLKEEISEAGLQRCAIKASSVFEEPVCFFEGFGHQGATIRVRAYVDGMLARHRFYQLRSDVLLSLNDVAFLFSGTAIGFEAHILSGEGAHTAAGHGGHGGGHGGGQRDGHGGGEGSH